jgi:thioredoxin 1
MDIMKDVKASEHVFAVGDRDFEQKVLKARLPVIVDFSAEWCPPCRVLEPVYRRLSAEYQGKLSFASVDIDENPIVHVRYRIQGVPTLILFKDGKEVTRFVGPHPGRLKRAIDSSLAEQGIG